MFRQIFYNHYDAVFIVQDSTFEYHISSLKYRTWQEIDYVIATYEAKGYNVPRNVATYCLSVGHTAYVVARLAYCHPNYMKYKNCIYANFLYLKNNYKLISTKK